MTTLSPAADGARLAYLLTDVVLERRFGTLEAQAAARSRLADECALPLVVGTCLAFLRAADTLLAEGAARATPAVPESESLVGLLGTPPLALSALLGALDEALGRLGERFGVPLEERDELLASVLAACGPLSSGALDEIAIWLTAGEVGLSFADLASAPA